SSQQMSKYLPGNAYEGSGINLRISQSGDQVSGTRTTCCEDHSGFTRGTCISLRRMYRSLFVPYQDMVQLFVIIVKGIIDRHDGTSGITKDRTDTFRD